MPRHLRLQSEPFEEALNVQLRGDVGRRSLDRGAGTSLALLASIARLW
jgi:hypothetical protein